MKAPEPLFWRVVDGLDYWVMLARLRIVDAVCGTEPGTSADRQRNEERERLKRALHGSDDPAPKGDSLPNH
jgi:hypothetical protein